MLARFAQMLVDGMDGYAELRSGGLCIMAIEQETQNFFLSLGQPRDGIRQFHLTHISFFPMAATGSICEFPLLAGMRPKPPYRAIPPSPGRWRAVS
jgi:hypothetical protein